MTDVYSRIQELPAGRRAALRTRLWDRGRTSASVGWVDVGEVPASLHQRRLVFIEGLASDSAAYVTAFGVRMTGSVDVVALEAALNQVVARHEALRTVLPVVDGAAIQRIRPYEPRPLPLIDVSGLDAATRGRESVRLAKTERTQSFDLASGPLTRYRLVRLGEQDFLLLLSFHHAIIDGWSTSVLARELSELYAAAVRGRPSTLAPLPLQFSEYARWQADWLESDEAARQLEYWSAKLSGTPEALTLPVDRPRSATPDDTGATHSFTVRADLADGLTELATRSGATLYMVLLAAFQVVLARFSGMDDILVGSAVANRRRAEFQKLIGMFANSVVLRGRPYPHLTFGEYLAQTRTVCLEAFEYQDLPLDVIVRRLRPGREMGRNPIYQVNFTLQNTPPDVPEMAGVRFDVFDDDRADPGEGARFDLDLGVWSTEQGLDCRLIYPVELFDASTVRRLADALCLVLAAVVENPDARLGSLPVIPEADLHAILHDFNDTAVDRPATLLVHRLFEAQAAAAPDAVAVADQHGAELTYRDLADRASRLAHRLVANGVRRGMVVGVLLERSPELVVALLGVLQAGAAYVPLDPAYPRTRLDYMLEDSGAGCLVTVPGLLARVGVADVPRVLVEADDDGAVAGPPALDQSGDDLMYVMYTSGSTGGAKGVMLAHRHVANYLLWAVRMFRIGEGSGVPVHSSVSFDLTVTSIFGSLVAGQRLDLLPDTDVPGEALHEYARTASDLTFVKLTPAHLPLIEAAARNSRPWTRSLVIGGEALVREHVSAWRLHSPATHLYNEWGPTEAAVGSAIYDARGDTAVTGPVPIGAPIDNVTIYVLDDQMSPVPCGVRGELYVGGAGVAYGYLNRAELTAARFVPDPFSSRPGARLYRTGDVGRLLPDGTLEFHGRRDDQVKIRGYRVEPGEVAATIVGHDHVRDCVVEVLRSTAGPRLVAFVSLVAADPVRSARQGVDDAAAARVEEWRSLYEDVYDEFESDVPAFFDLTGWTSCYTGDAIPAGEMRAWLDDTLDRVRALGPKRVLEIGVGSGMILGGVAPHVEHYLGTDFSHAAIDRLRELCDAGGPGAEWSVGLSVSPAHESLSTTDPVDTIVMNSVVQYFPSGDYLADVLKRCVDRLPDGGAVFIGDVRNLALLPLFQTSVQLHRASADARVAEVRTDRWRAIDDDRELCVDPRFFATVLAGHPRVTSIRVLPKRGRYRNELSAYRYDVVIEVGGAATGAEPVWLDWSALPAGVDSIDHTLRGDRPAMLAIRDIPNARVGADRRFAELLADAAPEAIVDDLVVRARSSARTGVELDDIWDVADRHGYRVEPSWARARPDGSFDVILYRTDAAPPVLPMVAGEDWRELVTEPMWRERCRAEQPAIGDYVAGRLPEHMRPTDYRFVRTVPLTANGKVDHVALRLLAADSAESAPGATAPRLSPTEDVIARIWCELLQLRTVRADDNFFDLGGHSLLTFQLGFRLRQAFDVEVPMRLPFEAPVLAELARRVDRLVQTNTAAQRDGELVRIERTEFMVASSAQERLWFLQELYPHSTQYNVPLFTWITGSLDTGAFRRALDAVVARHEILRTSLVNRDGKVFARISPAADSQLVHVDLSGLPASVATVTAQRLAANSHGLPFRLSDGAPFRVALLRLGPDRHLLLLTLHHIVTDGWSTGVLLDDVAELYSADIEHRPAELGELTIQYCDYAAWQQAMLAGEVAEDLRKYWRDKLDGVLTVRKIPADRPRPTRPTHRGARLAFTLSSAITERVHALCRSEQVTPFMVLICPVYALIRERTGTTDLVIGTDVANRADVATERLIGFFVNQLMLRVDASGDPTWRELLARVSAAALDGYAHQDLPFEQIVRMVNPRRGRDQSPLFQIKVTHNAPQPSPRLSGTALAPFDFNLPTARFDLALVVTEENGEFTGHWEYDTDLFDEVTVRELLERYLALFEEMVDELT